MDSSETASLSSPSSRLSKKQFDWSILSFRAGTPHMNAWILFLDDGGTGGILPCRNRRQRPYRESRCVYATFWRAVDSRAVTGDATLTHAQNQSADAIRQSVGAGIYYFDAAQREFFRQERSTSATDMTSILNLLCRTSSQRHCRHRKHE